VLLWLDIQLQRRNKGALFRLVEIGFRSFNQSIHVDLTALILITSSGCKLAAFSFSAARTFAAASFSSGVMGLLPGFFFPLGASVVWILSVAFSAMVILRSV